MILSNVDHLNKEGAKAFTKKLNLKINEFSKK